jgi:hypothetical protein
MKSSHEQARKLKSLYDKYREEFFELNDSNMTG